MSESINKKFQVFIKEGFDIMCYLSVNQYKINDSISIKLFEVETNEPFATLTICVPEFTLDNDNEILVKLYSENTCLTDLQYDNEFFEDTGRSVITGHNLANIWKIKNKELIEEINKVKAKNKSVV